MNQSETALMLGHIASYDRRTLGETDVLAWHAACHDLALEDTIEAIVEHYSETRDWMMPVDIRNRCHRIDRRRRGAIRAAELAAQRAADGVLEIEAAPPTEANTNWKALAETLRRQAHANPIQSPPTVDRDPDKMRQARDELEARRRELAARPDVDTAAQDERLTAGTTPVHAADGR